MFKISPGQRGQILNLSIWGFEFVSDFDIRTSSFSEHCATQDEQRDVEIN
jgi:hypothetical protein